MPILNWIGKDKVINHHLDVPYRILDKKYTHNSTDSENKIIHGDNLEALKSLLPEYEGRINCIYIDPPYNTGNEGWVYNDNVNDPKIKKWLGEVVGKESEDLTRHDKWLCMMYPRLKLLHRLLDIDGIIFISIDDNEQAYLKIICDEIFGSKNLVANFVWRTDGNFDNQAKIKINHEYILCYSKRANLLHQPNVIDYNVDENSKIFKSKIKNTIIKNGPKNPISEIHLPKGFPTNFESGIIKERSSIWPHLSNNVIVENYKLISEVGVKSGWSSKVLLELFIKNNFHPVIDTKGQETTFVFTKTGAIEAIKKRGKPSHVISSLQNLGSTQSMSSELLKMNIKFEYPKPNILLEYLLKIGTKLDSIILDSFAGSGTTAHAILNLNKEDKGNRKFILVEMEDYANSITAERVKKVIDGYGDGGNIVKGIEADFSFFELGEPMFLENDYLNEELPLNEIHRYIWYTETGNKFDEQEKEHKYLLGINENSSYYFFYDRNELTTLNYDFLDTIKHKSDTYVIYADNCILPKEFMTKQDIIFKKIPRDINRF